MIQRPKISGVYAITPATIADDLELIDKCAAALYGGATVLQYRDKNISPSIRHRRAELLAALCTKKQIPFIVNDHIDIAVQCRAGLHLGRADGDLALARQQLGPTALIGATCHHNLTYARAATAAGADYCAFGALFSSITKPHAPRCSPAMIRQARAANIATVVAIGGITAKNAARAALAGAEAIAVITAIFNAPNIAQATRDIVAAFDEGTAIFRNETRRVG